MVNRSFNRTVPAVLFSLFLFSCAPVHFQSGTEIHPDKIRAIDRGKTTKAEIEKLFGEPQMTGRDDDGLETWSYFYMDAEAPLRGGELRGKFQRITVTFDNGKVKSVSYELSK